MTNQVKYDINLTYARKDHHMENIYVFDRLAKKFGLTGDMFFPNHQPAPWHVQLYVDDTLYNFWPHVLKGHIAYTSHVVEGKKELGKFFAEILTQDENDIEVIE